MIVRRIVATAAALVVASSMAACGSDASTAAGGLTYWSMWKSGEPQQKVIAAAIDEFTRETGIKVDVEWAGRDLVKQKLPAALNTNNVPDLIDQAADQIKPYLADQKQARGLGAVYAAEIPGEPGKKVSDVIPAKYLESLGLRLPDGQPFIVPYTMSGVALFYDATALPDVAANPPKTWQEFMAALDRIKAGGTMAPLTNDADQGWANQYWMTYLLLRELSPGGFKKIAADKTGAAWRDSQVLGAAQTVENLVRGGYFLKGFDASKSPEQQKQWANGKAAFFLMGSWLPIETKTYAKPGLKYASLPFPATAGTAARSEEIALFGFAIPTKAKQPQQAERFISYLMNKNRIGKFATEADTLCIRPDVAAPEALAGLKQQLDQVPAVHAFGDDANFPGYQDKVYFPIFTELFTGKVSASQFIDKMTKGQADYWKSQG